MTEHIWYIKTLQVEKNASPFIGILGRIAQEGNKGVAVSLQDQLQVMASLQGLWCAAIGLNHGPLHSLGQRHHGGPHSFAGCEDKGATVMENTILRLVNKYIKYYQKTRSKKIFHPNRHW